MPLIYHLTTIKTWDQAQASGLYQPVSLATEGFIHASTLRQLTGSANRFFAGVEDLIVLAIDPARLDVPLLWEASPHSPDTFPHLYGPLATGAVLTSRSWSRGLDGQFSLSDLDQGLTQGDASGRSAS